MNIEQGTGDRRGVDDPIYSTSNVSPKSLLPTHNSVTFEAELTRQTGDAGEQSQSNVNIEKKRSSQNIITTALRSNTTYSAVANCIFASIFISTLSPAWIVVSILPVVLHLGLGVWGVANEQRSLKRQTPIDEGNVSRFFGQPGIMRRYQAGVFALQSGLSLLQFNLLDSIMFIAGAVGNNAAAVQTNRAAGYDPEPSSESRVQALLTSPGPWWVASDTIAAFRLTSIAVVFSSTPVAGLFVGGVLISLYSFTSTLKSLNNQQQKSASDAEKVFQCNMSAAQLSCFGLASFLVGNSITGVVLSLWAIASAVLARQMKNKS